MDVLTQVANLLNEEIPQIFTLCGRGPRSTLRLLRPGLAVTEMAVSPLPGNPTAVWTIKRSMLDEFDAYIIVSFTNATLVSTSHAPSNQAMNMLRSPFWLLTHRLMPSLNTAAGMHKSATGKLGISCWSLHRLASQL